MRVYRLEIDGSHHSIHSAPDHIHHKMIASGWVVTRDVRGRRDYEKKEDHDDPMMPGTRAYLKESFVHGPLF